MELSVIWTWQWVLGCRSHWCIQQEPAVGPVEEMGRPVTQVKLALASQGDHIYVFTCNLHIPCPRPICIVVV
ncbi:hypothetical protein BDU57DRAFT_508081 [Ampelomyces quisqualis]|uniref:Uncharacterized protein n=1 Tax=Ampelomyces quisqualis TaxID=50730 RepID=A0A6A5R1N5_AMPQU|nr:hypothetical protein BDU57DRAFT_508081 [Ampelomyces quisqualis]